ncbi:MAG: BtpA/SgcQ family protein [Pseudomonadota bacterium]
MTISLDLLRTAPRPLIAPVIHVQNAQQAVRNIDKTTAAGCPGTFLINHDFPMADFVPILRDIRAARPTPWLGVNFLGQTGAIAFPVLADLAAEGTIFNAYWADDARIDERIDDQPEAEEIARIRASSGWQGLYFAGVAFKKQRPVDAADFATAGRRAAPFMDVVTTSGRATGEAADTAKIQTFRDALPATPLAVASGITPENANAFAPLLDCILVATGINFVGNFYEIDPTRLAALNAAIDTP